MKHALILFLPFCLLTACLPADDKSKSKTPDIESEIVDPNLVAPKLLDHSGLPPLAIDTIDASEYLAGGEATVFLATKDAFSTRPDAVAKDFQSDASFTSGDHLFRTPHSGIGPILNTATCQGCHLNDGRGVVPQSATSPMTSMLVKLANADGEPDPVYGDQLQPFAVQSFTSSDFSAGLARYLGSVNGDKLHGEAFPFIEYESLSGTYPDGTPYTLRSPVYKVRDASFGELADGLFLSARVAPQVFGTGLLEAIPEAHILNLADEADRNGDGISGRPSWVQEAMTGQTRLGRFAYKAQNPSLLQQVAGAFNGDMGLTTGLFPKEPCTDAQLACIRVAEEEKHTAEQTDISDLELAMVEFYNRVLGVPARRGYDATSQSWDSDIQQGRRLFMTLTCSGCHTPRHVTGVANGSQLGAITLTGLEPNAEPIAILSEQVIYPYTDLLLHDMGGECRVGRELADGSECDGGELCRYVQRCTGLADGVRQGMASASEWKTPPLWGLGLVQTVNPDASFLHDGRARTIEEAILWHGGEAESAKRDFMALNKSEREQVLAFLESL